ncbi:MAG: NAD(P)H-hydrate dehydratase [Gemmatimonadota bacterium]|nr:NAD(P)H-hydrate dehydratase [Gemmatimonadota bacterium]
MADGGAPYGASIVEAPLASQASAFDSFAIRELGVPQAVLMENAGRQAAYLVQRMFPTGRVVGFVGAGNNGGDALVLLRTLQGWGRSVEAVMTSHREGPDALLHGWPVPRSGPGDLQGLEARLAGAVIIDGILGTGIQGPPRSVAAATIEMINRCPTQAVVALDTPSGVDGDTGAVPGAVVRADVTVAFGWPKLGTLLHPARPFAGRILAVEIGFPPVHRTDWARVITSGWAEAALPRRSSDTHKNRVGALCLLAGSAMPGAAVLAARSAFRAGCGVVRVGGTAEMRSLLLEACPEAIWFDADDRVALLDAVEASTALAAGPGMGTHDAARNRLDHLLRGRSTQGLVLDADALSMVAPAESNPVEGPVLVTPHPGEMARLTASAVAEVQADRPGSARRLAKRTGWAVLLKGAPSLVAGPDGRLMVAMLGSSDLAVAGMGDVLTGAASALVAQGIDVFTAGALALHLTGRSAWTAGKGVSLTPTDVISGLADAIAEQPAPAPPHAPFVTFDQPSPR